MLDFLFLAGQAASALLLLYGGYLALFSWIAFSPEFAPGAVLGPDMAVEVRYAAWTWTSASPPSPSA
jgi:hypothetical protein